MLTGPGGLPGPLFLGGFGARRLGGSQARCLFHDSLGFFNAPGYAADALWVADLVVLKAWWRIGDPYWTHLIAPESSTVRLARGFHLPPDGDVSRKRGMRCTPCRGDGDHMPRKGWIYGRGSQTDRNPLGCWGICSSAVGAACFGGAFDDKFSIPNVLIKEVWGSQTRTSHECMPY